MKLNITDLAFHRNGICGAPFHVVLFHAGDIRMVGIVFDEKYHCAVLDVDKLAAGDIAFRSNSWRGDSFEPTLRQAIAALQHADEAKGPGGEEV